MKKVLFVLGILAVLGGGAAVFLGKMLPDKPTLYIGSAALVLGIIAVIRFYKNLYD